MDSNLVNVMVSIDTLKNDISNKEVDIIRTKQDLAKAQKARDKQYESMKKRIQCLYEQGGDSAWFQMMLNSEDLSDLLTRCLLYTSVHKRLRQVEYRTQAPDHPILWSADESYYLKFYIFQVCNDR